MLSSLLNIGKNFLGGASQGVGNLLGMGGFVYSPQAQESAPQNIQQTVEVASSGSEGFRTIPIMPAAGYLNPALTIAGKARDALSGFGGGFAGGLGIDTALDFFGGGNDVCSTNNSMKPYSINKQSGCISVTRKQQARLKEMVGVVGLEQTASAVGLDTNTLVLLLLKRFKARGRGITASSMRTTKRTIRQIKSLHNEVSSMAGRRAPVRRAAAVKQVKYSN